MRRPARDVLAACAFAAGCLVAWPVLAAAEVVYVPPEDMGANQREVAALHKQLKAGGGFALFLEKAELSIHQTRHFISWDWKDDGIVTRTVQGSRPSVEFKYEAMPKIEVIHDTVLGASFYGVRLSEEWAIWCQTDSPSMRLVCGKWLGETFSLFRNRHAAMVEGRAAFEARFREALAKYPDPSSRPPLPEEARRFKVQAEAAVERKEYAEALNRYGAAVEAAPWWSEGYFNVALLFAEQKIYASALKNMKRFLLLEPNHPQARAAQDQIYRWEALAGKP
jgi:tetratricopeptide (TPR) repeat protein